MRVRKSAEERKSEIVEATLRLADKGGPDRLATETIATALGITQAALFRHFPRKQDLWEAVAARIGEKFQRRWVGAETPDAPAAAKLRLLIGAQLGIIRATPAIPAILFSRELHAENERLRKIFYGLMERLQALVRGIIQAGQAAGEFRADLDANDAAFLVIGLVQGLVLRWSLSGRSFDLAAEGERLLAAQLHMFGASSDQAGSGPTVGAQTKP